MNISNASLYLRLVKYSRAIPRRSGSEGGGKKDVAVSDGTTNNSTHTIFFLQRLNIFYIILYRNVSVL